MSVEVISVLVYVGLIFVMVHYQARKRTEAKGLAYNFGNRDVDIPLTGKLIGRIDRTLANLQEGALMYLPLILLAITLDVSNAWIYWSAVATIISRVLYVPIYLGGLAYIRTIVWLPSALAIPALLIGLYVGLA